MTKIIYKQYDKKLISTLPVVSFPGRIVTVFSPGETRLAVNYLLSQDILGVDTETRPSFKKGYQHAVSLLQVSSRDVCFLFRLNFIGMTPDIIRFLEDTTVPKIGLSWHDDVLSLKKRCDFTPGLFIDLQEHVGEIGIEDLSLQKIFANLFGQKITKKEQLSNWENQVLTDKQKLYAATDAWACIKIYDELMRLKASGDYELIDNKAYEIQDSLPEER